MFGSILKAAKSVVDVTDSTVGLVTKPVTDGLDHLTESLNDLIKDDDR